jgi:CDP-glucose 4,6-dehydratase
MGTVNVLNAASNFESVKSIGVITTDKVYKNLELERAFLEDDSLSGKDPYSASKVAAEAAVAAWQTISNLTNGPRIIALRAGNVIGGGDYSQDRLLPDIIRSYQSKQALTIRNPESTRPWQHVLDPLAGYLLAIDASLGNTISPSFNFGPLDKSLTVREVVMLAEKAFAEPIPIAPTDSQMIQTKEGRTLSINPDRAILELGWRPKYTQRQSIAATINWWESVLKGEVSAIQAIKRDISQFLEE